METIDISSYSVITPSVVSDDLVPFLSVHGNACQVTLGLMDGTHHRVQRMICSLMDKYPRAEFILRFHDERALHPMLRRRAKTKLEVGRQ